MSANEQRLFGQWDQIKGKIKEHWGQITDDELAVVEGHYDHLVGLIQQKTGEARQQIMQVIDDLCGVCGGTFQQAKQTAREYIDQANQTAQESAEMVRERAREGYVQSRDFVRRRPAESVAVAFGTGVLIGLIVGLSVRSR